MLFVRLWSLLPLYTDADLRSRTQALVQATAVREGWLLSGISIQEVHYDTVTVQYRSYVRGHDRTTCHSISQYTAKLSPCNDS